jgi:hypothetical protein
MSQTALRSYRHTDHSILITHPPITSSHLSTLAYTRTHAGEQLTIDGVDFKVVAAEPVAGVVTMRSTIYAHGEPLRAEQLARQQVRVSC